MLFQLHIDAGSDEVAEENKETDFFDSMSSTTTTTASDQVSAPAPVKQQEQFVSDDGAAPDVSLAVATPAPVQAPAVKKSALLSKKPGAKKPGGLGGKKGLGAQKVVKV